MLRDVTFICFVSLREVKPTLSILLRLPWQLQVASGSLSCSPNSFLDTMKLVLTCGGNS